MPGCGASRWCSLLGSHGYGRANVGLRLYLHFAVGDKQPKLPAIEIVGFADVLEYLSSIQTPMK